MSIVITPETKTLWEKAISKAKLIKPRVKVIGFGHFEVEGSKGDWHTVRFTRNEHGEFEVSCSCQGHQRGLACYHCPPCGSIFKLQVAQRSEARKASEPTHDSRNCEIAEQILRDSTDINDYTLPSLEEAKARCEAERAMLVATGWQPGEPSEPNDSALIECCKCGNEYPEAAMTGAGDNAICDDCLMFG